MEPADTIISKLGGAKAVADLTGVHRTRVSSWRWPKSKRGTGGLIPPAHHRVIFNALRQIDPNMNAEILLNLGDSEAAE